MSFETISFEENNGLGLLKINRPKALNALNAQVLKELDTLLDECKGSKTLRCLIVTGNSEKSFVAGADIKEFQGVGQSGAEEIARRGQSVFSKIESLPQPVIAAVNGFALGGGLELALACDFIICSEKARFGLPEVSLGIMPGFGGTQRLAQAVGIRNARLMTYTGSHFKADAALSMGLAHEVVSAEALLERCHEIAGQIMKQAPLAVAAAKSSILAGADIPLEQGMQVEAKEFGQLFLTKDADEGIAAFIEKRKPEFNAE